MDGISLYDDCVMPAYIGKCGKSVSDLYADELLGKTYCWVTTEFPHRIVALFTLANDSIKTKLISSNDKNRL